jgi:hypothetical protein
MNFGKYLNVTGLAWMGWRGGGDCIPEWAHYLKFCLRSINRKKVNQLINSTIKKKKQKQKNIRFKEKVGRTCADNFESDSFNSNELSKASIAQTTVIQLQLNISLLSV